jgi:hypothetical protein
MKITTQMLTKRNACAAQVALFKKLFGPEAEVTLDNCLTAVEAGLSIDWAAVHLLPPERLQAYRAKTAETWKACQTAKDDAWKACQAEKEDVWQAYETATADARQAYHAKADAEQAYWAAKEEAWIYYDAATENAWKAYETARDNEVRAYRVATAAAFYHAATEDTE